MKVDELNLKKIKRAFYIVLIKNHKSALKYFDLTLN